MSFYLILSFLSALGFKPQILVKSQPDWSFDLVSVDAENNTPDIVTVDLIVTRPSRGIFAMGGIVDFKQDILERTLWSASVYYSLTGSNFIRTPFQLVETKYAVVMNTFYKDLIMESVLNCSDNAPRIDGEFKPPLTKRTIYLHDCIISNENMPSRLRNGYYKVIFRYRNHGDGSVEILVKVFNDW